MKNIKVVPEELQNLSSVIADTYIVETSVFFTHCLILGPLVGFSLLCRCTGSMKGRRVTGCCVGCHRDSDGRIDRLNDLHNIKKTLLPHTPDNEEYYFSAPMKERLKG